MKRQDRKELLEQHKKIFIYYHQNTGSSRLPISWGLECGNGWIPLIWDLCDIIQHHVDWKQKADPKFQQVEVHQCKEKFGSLRFYTGGGDEYVDGAIAMAEYISSRTCEQCGVPGEMRKDGWWRVTCDPCEEKRAEKMKNSEKSEIGE